MFYDNGILSESKIREFAAIYNITLTVVPDEGTPTRPCVAVEWMGKGLAVDGWERVVLVMQTILQFAFNNI